MALQVPSSTAILLPTPTGPFRPPMPSSYTYDDVPLSLEIKPDWAYSRRPTMQHDCIAALRTFPKTGPVPPLLGYQTAHHGGCALGLHVTDPTPGYPNYVEETWARVFELTWHAVQIMVGTLAAGWSLNLRSGVQIVFFEPTIMLGFGLTLPNLGGSMESALDTITPPRPSGLPVAIWQDTPPDPAPEVALAEQGITVIPTMVSTDGSLTSTTLTLAAPLPTELPAQVPFMIPYAMPAWTDQPPVPLQDCKLALKPFFQFSWFFSHAGMIFDHIHGNTVGRCTVAFYLTDPRPELRRTRPGAFNIYHEAWSLALSVITQHGSGGFMDLPNGLQLLFYEIGFIDPQNVCAIMNRISLRACLDNRVVAKERAEQRALEESNRLVSMLSAVMQNVQERPSLRTTRTVQTSTALEMTVQGND